MNWIPSSIKAAGILYLLFSLLPKDLTKLADGVNFWFSTGNFHYAFIYFVVFLLAWIGFFVALTLHSLWLRGPVVLFLIAGYAVDTTARSFLGSTLTFETARLMFKNLSLVGQVVIYYPGAIVTFGLNALLFATILCMPSKLEPKSRNFLVIVPIIATILVFSVSFYSENRNLALPSFYSSWAKIFKAVTDDLYDGPRESVDYENEISPRIKHIVLIVDESVRGDSLSINGGPTDTTPFLSGVGEKLINFGVATSAWNCSKQSRIILRSGLRMDQVPDLAQRSLKNPTIWQFAQLAGYRTVLFDAWIPEVGLHSYMNEVEFSQIDEVITAADQSAMHRDHTFASRIKELLKSEKPTFILVNKFGTHIPYESTFPSQFSYDFEKKSFYKASSSSLELPSVYTQALRWSVDRFFQMLFANAQFNNSVIIYTSDHGQRFDRDRKRSPHCNLFDVDVGEGLVPLILVSENLKIEMLFREHALKHRNGFSHFQIFPTILFLMGFDPNWIRNHYDNSLLDAPSEKSQVRSGSLFSTFKNELAVIFN